MKQIATEQQCDVFRVVRRAEQFCTVKARRIKVCGSWWHIQHADGTVSKENGGGVWKESISSAWFCAITACGRRHRLAQQSNLFDEQAEWRDYRDLIYAAMEELFELGRLHGSLECIRLHHRDDEEDDHSPAQLAGGRG